MAIVRQLEIEVRAVAEFGQQLLTKHELFVEEAQKEKAHLLAELERQAAFSKMVEKLEVDNRDLEDQNHRTMNENMVLMRRLEELNNSLFDADWRNNDLRSELQRAESNVGQLSHRAFRTRALESRIASIEAEKEGLEQELKDATRHSQTSEAHHRLAEQQIVYLQTRLEEMNAELQEQRAHVQCGLSLRKSSKDLSDHPASRSPNNKTSEKGLGVVITELLSNNASLQRTLDDLGSRFNDSQDEILMLRESLQRTRLEFSVGPNDGTQVNLGPRKTISQELHQHHHYHYHKKFDKRGKSRSFQPSERNSTRSKSSLCSPKKNLFLLHNPNDILDDGTRMSTPLSVRYNTGLVSPPATDCSTRDSGYFSFATGVIANQHNISSNERETNPSNSVLDDESFYNVCSTPTSLSKHQRSSSLDSVYARNSLYDMFSSPSRCLPSLQDELACQTAQTALVSFGNKSILTPRSPVKTNRIRRSASEESLTNPRPSARLHQLLPAMRASRRLYPSPLQNVTSAPTVSITSEPIHTFKTGNVSCNSLLRNAAAAQKQSATSPSSGLFWKKGSQEKSIAGEQKARWPFPRWSSNPSGTASAEEARLPSPVKSSRVDHDLLQEALSLV